ncbi:MAG: NADH-quinone oxidoreductase subunit NuoN, partial [Alphaproteobacteria bacterium]|nr:NADH-quinone oxidoreductase subunit NuoN [Alphaproteobacteria bacterium]
MMDPLATPNLGPALPEIFLACAAMLLLLVGVWRKRDAAGLVSGLAVAALIATFVLILSLDAERVTTFADMFVSDRFAIFMKGLVLIGSGVAIAISITWMQAEKALRFEYPVLILLATVGMMMMVSANDLVSLYVGLELQSLSLYVLAAFRRDDLRASEAGLKYFVLGALSSGMLLYGSSLIYGFTGVTNFDAIAGALRESDKLPAGVMVGFAFLVAGLAFKISAVPFHMWTPDVYEGAPTPVTAFFAVTPKVAAFALLLRVMVSSFGDIAPDWQLVVSVIAIASMALGAFAAIGQENIKRLLAYSSIGHVGYALVGLAAANGEGLRGIVLYLAIYLAMNVGAFGCVILMRRREGATEQIGDLAGLARNHPVMAFALATFM